ncbi:NUDIX hydrolase [Paenibacillus hexagrammi]|uniref:NUDIX domain-containing protein n=1 Tax=Paenibacillus hexagrammi TaxID=2908839 RepID=A0ABY3SND1_9BACL|nr:NUDIX domain-containing protein [Paenibacillus sp. YPD9-1]UJF35060.1 NUDIX domain-containing protein [Paenibacillus sp. YPD9-1]
MKGAQAVKEISAGGVVYRHQDGQLQIQLIQDRYGKITLAKGKMEPGETIEETALREIVEETGIQGKIIESIEMIAYQYTHPQYGFIDKEVHYYLVEALGGDLQAQIEEIRGVEWLDPDIAWRKQLESGYDNNNSVLSKALHKLGYEVQK